MSFVRTISKEKTKELYSCISNKEMTNAEKYIYLTNNDPDILAYKKEILKIVTKRGLGSFMNDTKWLKLQSEIENLPFPPAYFEKLITDENFRYSYPPKSEASFFGDWSPFYMEGMPLFFAIEYLIVIPTYVEHVGKYGKGKTLDISEQFETILNTNHIPFEKDNGYFIIYGYK